MKGEIPVLKRCCVCVPLRYGLLVWGYLKMTADALLITFISFSVIEQLMWFRVRTDNDFQSQIYEDMIVPVFAVAVFLADFVATILFIIGGHKKNVGLIRVFFFISIAMWIFTIFYAVLSVVLIVHDFIQREIFVVMVVLRYSFCFMVLTVQTYFLILLRSEITKLEHNGEFQFVNNEAEAECTMKCEEIIAGEETGREDI